MVSVLQLGIFLTVSICMVSSASTKNDTFYLFYAPKRFSPDSGLNITVLLFGNIKDATTVTIKLKDNDRDVKTAIVKIPVDESKAFIKMDTKDLDLISYTLSAKGEGGVDFNATFSVQCTFPKWPIHVQTDKPIYKPGETVKLRAFSLYGNTTVNIAPMRVFVYDAHSNLLFKWSLTGEKGVYSGEFPISSRPVLGTWNIEVVQDKMTRKTSIEVDKYVLPKVEVTLDVPEDLYNLRKSNYKGIVVDIKVRARYTQGKPVTGTAKLNIEESCLSKNHFSTWIQGETTFKIDLGSLVKSGRSCYKFKIKASVVNDLDKSVIHADEEEITIKDYPIIITTSDPSRFFTPNIANKFQIAVKRHDKQPLTKEEIQNPLKISVINSNFTFATSLIISKDGLVSFSMVPPERNYLQLEVIYKGVFNSVSYEMKQIFYYSRAGLSNHRLSIVRINEESSNLEFQLTFPEPRNTFFYTVVSNSKVFISEVVNQQPETTATFSFDTSGMFLKAHVIAGYVEKNGELRVATTTAIVKRETKGQSLKAKYAETTVKPGSDAELILESSPDTRVYVAAVDKSVLLLANPNDIVYEAILNSFEEKSSLRQTFRNGRLQELNRLDIESVTNLKIFYWIAFDADFVEREKVLTGTAAGSGVQRVKTRKLFPETWMWETIDIKSTKPVSYTKRAPDTITSWVTNIFALHPTDGLSVIEKPLVLKTFLDFYISLGLPYSLIRGEKFILDVYVFKYTSKAETVTVQLMNLDKTVKEEKQIQMTAGQTEKAVKFTVEPKVIGIYSILVHAFCSSGKDAVLRNLTVKPEGKAYYMNHPISINVSKDNSFETTVNIKYPQKVVEGSKVVSVSLTGDIMGPVLNGLEKLIRVPTGCGEQTMLGLYPNVFVIIYLKTRGKLNPDTRQKIVNNINEGVQNELSYQRKDHSFSAFGNSDKSGSTWLTAYVIKCFCEIRYHVRDVSIDRNVIKNSVSWLLRQETNGIFKEVGKVIHKDMQGGVSSDVTMTAFVTISLLQAQKCNLDDLTISLSKPVKYLRSWVNNRMAKDAYSLSVVLTAFALLNDEYFDRVEKQLSSLAKKTDKMMYWETTSGKDNSKSVEIASYALLAYSYKKKINEAKLIEAYLITQQNSRGGFYSTQDTVMALTALTQYSMLFSPRSDSAVNVEIETDEGNEYTFETINPQNSMMLFKKDLPSETENVKVMGKGVGFALVQVSWQFNLIPDEENKDLLITVNQQTSTPENIAKYEVCSKYSGKDQTGMVIIEVDILTGYSANLVDSEVHELIMRSEVEDNTLVVYLDMLPKYTPVCFPVTMERDVEVENYKPQVARVAFYYEPDISAQVSYTTSGNVFQSISLVLLLLSVTLIKLLI